MLDVVARSPNKGLAAAGTGVETEIMQRENLFEVRGIVLGHVSCEIGQKVVQRAERSLVIEGAVPMRNDEHDGAPGLHDSHPRVKRLQGVCYVLEDMGREEEVVGDRRHPIHL